jgi:biotin transport system substrate-specific component
LTTSRSRLRTLDLAYIALFSVLIAISSWLSIPFPVPFTLQTFAVFLTLMTLGGQRGFYAVLAYLLMGAAGLPVFSGFQGGFGVFLGATGGYLTGFLASAFLYRILTSKHASPSRTVIAALAGLLTCYSIGTLWFSVGYASESVAGIRAALLLCVVPYVIPDLVKLTLAFVLSRRLKQYLK